MLGKINQHSMCYKYSITFFIILLSAFTALAVNKDDNKFVMQGRVKVANGNSDGITVTVFNRADNSRELSFISGKSGKVRIELQYHKKYFLDFEKEGFFKKRFDISTHVPEDVYSRDSLFKPFKFDVKLHSIVAGYKPDFSKDPIGEIKYSRESDKFEAFATFDDNKIAKQIKVAKVESNNRAFDGHVSKGKIFEGERDFKMALDEYMMAFDIRPRDAFVRGKIRDIRRKLTEIEKIPEINEEISEIAVRKEIVEEVVEEPAEETAEKDIEKVAEKVTEKVAEKAVNETVEIQPEKISVANKLQKPNGESVAVPVRKEAIDIKALKEKQFNNLMKKGEAAWNNMYYEGALRSFEKAYDLKNDPIAKKRYREALDKVSKMSAARRADRKFEPESEGGTDSYSKCIAKADKEFKLSEWNIARFYYFEAMKFNSGSKYAKERVEECDRLIDANISYELQRKYQVFVKNGDAAMANGRYSNARVNYTKALDIKSWEHYPAEKINEIGELMKGWRSEKEREQYMQAIKKADNAFGGKNYAVARFYYRKAIAINADPYPKNKLAEIEDILANVQTEARDRQYSENIQKADNAFNSNNFSVARFYYQKALQVKPNENYPKKQLQKME